ncbi:choline-phosphate cytidylyltransferase [Coemansia sp. RSA 552]|nr:choline-phosphate cytidylyltransferase [Coemansia sp. RSA 552]
MSSNEDGSGRSSRHEFATSAPSSPKLTVTRSPSPSLQYGDPGSPMGLGDCDPNILRSFKPIETNMTYDVPADKPYMINAPPTDRPVRLYCDGIYDLVHYGHMRALEQAKKSFPNVYLLVGMCNDEDTHTRKGKTVLTENERYESMRHCRWVDEIITDAPWIVTQEFLDKHKIDYVCHDDLPYASAESDDVYAFVKAQGRFMPTQRTDGVSTSDVITRIVRDYDKYLRRNLERGMSPKELNISFLKEQELNLQKHVSGIREQIKKNIQGTREDLVGELEDLKAELQHTKLFWEDRRQDFVRGFSSMFGTQVIKIFGRKRRDSDSAHPENGSPSKRIRKTNRRCIGPIRRGALAPCVPRYSAIADLRQGRALLHTTAALRIHGKHGSNDGLPSDPFGKDNKADSDEEAVQSLESILGILGDEAKEPGAKDTRPEARGWGDGVTATEGSNKRQGGNMGVDKLLSGFGRGKSAEPDYIFGGQTSEQGDSVDPMQEFERILEDMAGSGTKAYTSKPQPLFWDEKGINQGGEASTFLEELNPQSLFGSGPRASAFSAGTLRGDPNMISSLAARVQRINKTQAPNSPSAEHESCDAKGLSKLDQELERKQLSKLTTCHSVPALSSFMINDLLSLRSTVLKDKTRARPSPRVYAEAIRMAREMGAPSIGLYLYNHCYTRMKLRDRLLVLNHDVYAELLASAWDAQKDISAVLHLMQDLVGLGVVGNRELERRIDKIIVELHMAHGMHSISGHVERLKEKMSFQTGGYAPSPSPYTGASPAFERGA